MQMPQRCSFGEIGNAFISKLTYRSTPFKFLRLGNSAGSLFHLQRRFLLTFPRLFVRTC